MAAVRPYECSRCGLVTFGFRADQVSAESRSHLVIDEDGGVRFWGRPIGNAVALDATGTADRDDHEPVFDLYETGDFFEYQFYLTDAQANELAECMCYCDAKPAEYLAGQDFWARDPGSEEWTPGFYIDDDPSTPDIDETGQEIQDYRYILYVNDVVQRFDPSISVPVPGTAGNEPRQEYVMPYVFHFRPGLNKISLRMSGGYRSTFYNFFFRAV